VITTVDDESLLDLVFPAAATAETTVVSTMPMVANPPVKGFIGVGSVAVAGFVPAFIFVALGGVAVSKVDVGGEGDGIPAGFLEDATEPSPSAAIDGTFQKGLRLGLAGTGALERVGTVPDGGGGLVVVVLFLPKGLRVVHEGRAGVVATLLAVGWKGWCQLSSSRADVASGGEGCAERESDRE